MAYVKIEQQVPCVFGKDHKITVILNEDFSIKKVFTSCYAENAETRGLILLGTPPMDTCLGYQDEFFKSIQTRYEHNSAFNNTILRQAIIPIRTHINNIKTIRTLNNKNVIEEDFINRYLQPFIQTQFEEADGYFTIKKNNEENQLEFYIINAGQTLSKLIAKRCLGVWEVHQYYEAQIGNTSTITSWSACDICETNKVRGYHNTTAVHYKNLTYKTFIALQATSTEGINLIKANPNEPDLFTYRKNSKKLVGVKLV